MTSVQTPRRLSRRLARLTLWVSLGLGLLMIVAGGGLLWRLSAGPVVLPFLTPYLEEALVPALGGRRISVQQTLLAWDVETRALEVRARQVTIRQPDDTPLATIPRIDVRFSLGALLRGSIALTAINIEASSAVLIRTPEGTFQVSPDSAAPPPAEEVTPDTAARQAPVITELLQNLLAEPGALAPLSTLQALRVTNDTLMVQDKRLGATWHVTQFDLTLRRQQHGLTGTGRLTVAFQDTLTHIKVTLAYHRAVQKLTLDTAFTDLRPAALATVMTDVEALAGLDLSVNGALALALDGQGHLETLRFTLTAAAGRVASPAVWSEPLAVSDLVVRGHFDGTAGTLHLDEATVTLDAGAGAASAPNLRLTGRAEGLGGDVTVQGEMALTALPMATLTRFWPVPVGSEARAWVSDHLHTGQVDTTSVNVVLALPGGHVGQTTLKRLDGTLRAHLPMAHAAARFETTLVYTQETEQGKLDLSFTDLRPAALATVVPAWQAVAGLDVPFRGTLAAVLDTQGQLRDLRFTLSGGPGSLSYAPVLPHARPISSLMARGHVDGTGATLHLEEATVTWGTTAAAGPRLSLQGTVQALKQAMTVNGQVSLTGLDLATLHAYWPADVSVDTRAWLTDNLVAGMVEEATAQVRVAVPHTPGSPARLERLQSTLRYQNCTVHYLRPLPPATGVSGSASFDQHGGRLQLNTGQITDMQITDGTVEITGFDRGPGAMALHVGVDGPLRTVLTVLNHPHINLPTDLGIHPATTDGQVTAQLGLGFPLHGQLRLPQVDITLSSTLKDVAIPQAFLGHAVEHGQLTLALNNAGLTLTGTAAFATIPLTVAWQEAFTTNAAWKSDIHVTAAQMDSAQLARFGLNVADFVAGPLAVTVTARRDHQGQRLVQARVNLQDTQLTLPLLDWHKPPREPGEAEGTMRFTDSQAPAWGEFRIQAGTLATSGTVQFNRAVETSLHLALRDLVVGTSHFETVSIVHRPARLDVTLGEGVLDAQPLLRTLWEQDTAPGKTGVPDTSPTALASALVVSLHAPALRRVSLGDAQYVQEVAATLTHGPEGWRTIDLAARIPDAFVPRPRTLRQTVREDQAAPPTTFALHYRPTAQGLYALSVRADDVGATLRLGNLYDGMTGGRLTIEGHTTTPQPDGPLQGTIEVKDFTLQRAPFLSQLLAAASLTGLLNTLRHDGLGFTQLRSDVTLTDRTLTLQQLRAYGGALGFTVTGSIDRHARSMDLHGTIIPLYRANTVLGKIPVVGELLLGGKGQGLVAIAAQVTGRLADPQISVKPATAVTPGFLRGFFDLFGSSGGTDSQPPPPQE